LSGTQVLEILLDEAEKFTGLHKNFSVNFLVMGTRHKDVKLIEKHVDLTQKYFDPSSAKPTVCGFDLAGKESGNPPGKFGELFLPLHKKFVNITTHAGEMTSEKDIWEAIFVLHAKRIGHGLKLYQNPEMIKFLRDYKLILEMCPSSNFQTNDFSNGEKYPLKNYLEQGIKVTVNSDNYGISQTNITSEFLQASLMTEGGLTKWEILRLLKNGFKAAFLPLNKKNELLRKVDTEVFELLLKDYL
ncbi:hypothetical protein IT568_00095, partial [bacterium]|nr:hypothetical protein [bacterium]